MPTTRSSLIIASSLVLACARGDSRGDSASAHATAARTDSAFAALQQRGADARGMGVDQSTSTHRFDVLSDGGRIELQRDMDDPAGIAQIRRHLREVATAFSAGDFTTPEFVHARDVPGTDVMAAKHGLITYVVRDLPRGAELRITTHDPESLKALHAFLTFQRGEHRAGGAGDASQVHDAMAH